MSVQWEPQQLQNAATIYQVGRRMGASTRDIQIALITALDESGLNNVNFGDRDSLGLFQQRPSQGWGTPTQVMNPTYAAAQFYKHLLGLGSSRYNMSMWAAAQAVQRSGTPDGSNYQNQMWAMRAIWPQVEKQAGVAVKKTDGTPYFGNEPVFTLDDVPTTDTEIPWQGKEFDPLTTLSQASSPDAMDMLGAWGFDPGSSLQEPTLDENNGATTTVSPGTFQQLIQPMYQENPNTPYAKGVNGWRKAVVQAARGALGTPYVWGGDSLANGVDCSGLVQQAFARAGITMPRISYQQANRGERVGIDQLRPGDLVAWDNSSRNPGADHIAIYIGNGNIIEAPRPGLAVRVSHIGKSLDGGWGVHLNI